VAVVGTPVKCSTMALKLEVSVFSTVVGTRRDGLTRFFFTFTTPEPRHKPPDDAAAAVTAGCGGPLGNAEEYLLKPELVFAAPETSLIIMPQEVPETALVVTDVASALLISDAAIRRMSSSGFMPAAK